MPDYLDVFRPKLCVTCGHRSTDHFGGRHCFASQKFSPKSCSCTSYVEQPQPGQEAASK